MSEPRTIRWGILATGGIAGAFTRDLLVDPKTRGVTNIRHEIAAAASSSSKQRAQDFLSKDVKAPASAKAYGSYEELVQDPNVDVIYIATPHSHHYQNARLCLEARKHVLCEKAFTVNAAQARELVALAKKNNCILIEAVWTRYFPLSIYIREQITSGRLGTVTRVAADLSNSDDPLNKYGKDGNKHRMVNASLAGGALLDLGVYPINWCFQTLYLTQDPATRQKPTVQASVKKYAPTGVDETSSMILTFPRPASQGGDAHGIATTSINCATDSDDKGSAGPAVRVYGSKGEATVYFPTYRPTRTRVVLSDGTIEDKNWPQPGPGKGSGFYNGFGAMNAEGEGHGMFWEADEAGFALVEGRQEGRFLGWEESCVIMEVCDEVRKQGGIRYPEEIETLKYPVALKG
ncbi:MAG: hypothetical protein Q9162_003032 [Coniocarpon cinnabarinum]